jgi:hypothetical protein
MIKAQFLLITILSEKYRIRSDEQITAEYVSSAR